MKYGCSYRVIELNDSAMTKIQRTLDSEDLVWKDSLTHNSSLARSSIDRISKQAWVRDHRFCEIFMDIAIVMNQQNLWNLAIQGVEPIQYGIYPEGGKYDWHVDQHPKPIYWANDSGSEQGVVRKISMTVNLNDASDYEGGNLKFDLGPHFEGERFKVFDDSRTQGSVIIFPSFMYHCVTPVTSGTRFSLVLWVLGKPWQ